MRDELNRLTSRWMDRCPPRGKHSYSDKVELAKMEKRMKDAELKSLDLSEDDVE